LEEAAALRQPLLQGQAAEGRQRVGEALAAANFEAAAAALAARMDPAEQARGEGRLRGLESELGSARAAAAESESALGLQLAADIGALTEAAGAAAANHAALAIEFDTVREERARLATLVEACLRLQGERTALDASSGRLAALAELLAGNVAPRRLPFKTFVLAAYFRAVVGRASLRLGELSDGRYTLIVDEGQGGGRGRIGLDLLVRDAWTGRTRPSGTLSGGERFLSSLALALGLADTIRSRSGGVSLDAIFIDEGFGSLDEEALDRAVSALDRVRGDRVIGIVSHVAELRSRIPSRIEVIKGKEGSKLSICE
jgi:exonuclease SbcC